MAEPAALTEVVVRAGPGALRGVLHDGVAAFKGVPYAAPPFGRNRFLPPQPAPAWSGVRDAIDYGPVAPQTPYPPPFYQLLGDQGTSGEDCLNLNLWTPDPGGRGLPVMVWVPGGAFARGSGALPVYDGRRFARDGVVCVTINYRLGADGFLWFGEGTPNRGLLDQVAALRWVQENVAAFGGDPAQVTVFGESAGAFSIGALLAMPAADGLFRRAVLQSGAAHHSISPTTAAMVGRNLAQALGVEPSLEAVGRLPLDLLLRKQTELAAELALRPDPARWGEVAANAMMFEPVVDGTVLPQRPCDHAEAGGTRELDLMVGVTAQEFRFFMVPNGVIDQVSEDRLKPAAAALGLGPQKLAVYRQDASRSSPGEVLQAVMTDWFFRIPGLRLAEAHSRAGGAAFVYEFAWGSPLFEGRLGACHALELGFVFDNLEAATGITGPHPPQALANAMHRDWVAFASSGDPGWPGYRDDRRTVMRYGAGGGTAVDDPGAAERRLWDGVR
jgi:para-nitrobenzyl esterase